MGREGSGDWESVKCIKALRWENSRAKTGRERRGRLTNDRWVSVEALGREA
jgi:hypothetical protein